MDFTSESNLFSLDGSSWSPVPSSPPTEVAPAHMEADEYALHHGLTFPGIDPWSDILDETGTIAATIVDVQPSHLIENGTLQECAFRPIIPAPEQWQVPAESMQLLQQTFQRCTTIEVADLMEELCLEETPSLKELKLEPPIIRSDHNSDCHRLRRRVTSFRKDTLPDHGLPLEDADVTEGEGLEFAENANAMEKELLKKAATEPLEVTKETVGYLVQILKTEWIDKDQWDLLASNSTYHGLPSFGATEPLSPPLSPMLEPFDDLFVPDEETSRVPQPSSPFSDISEEIRVAENKLLQQDEIFWDEATTAQISPDRSDDMDIPEMIRGGLFESSVLPPIHYPLPEHPYLDVPIFPPLPHSQPDDALWLEDLTHAGVLTEPRSMSPEIYEEERHLSRFFDDKAATLVRYAEQERLEPLDAIARVSVPLMDFSLPTPAWEQQLQSARAQFGFIRGTTDVDWQGTKWGHNRAAEQRIVWTPMAHMKAKTLAPEAIKVDQGHLDHFLGHGEDEHVMTSEDLVRKKPGLLILQMHLDDDEELLPLSSTGDPTLTTSRANREDGSSSEPLTRTTVTHRARPVEDGVVEPPVPGPVAVLAGQKRLRADPIEIRPIPRPSAHPPTRRMLGLAEGDNLPPVPTTDLFGGLVQEYPDFRTLLDSFVAVNFRAVTDRSNSGHPSYRVNKLFGATQPAESLPALPEIPAAAPDIAPPEQRPRIVASFTAVGPMAQFLTKLLPGIEIVRRDYKPHRPATWFPGLRSPNLDDADLTISPATGIMLLTMVKLRQRPMPGQPDKTVNYHSVVQNAALRYERLIVFVSEGNKFNEAMTPLSQSDAKALAEFQGFVGGLDTEVRVLYVGGGTETLAKWVAKTICDHASEQADVRSLVTPPETHQEAFLFRAGMNVFAAQVILKRLSVPADGLAVGGKRGQSYGLPKFLMMSLEDRIAMLEELLGGRKILERASRVLDEPWGQHAVGEYDDDDVFEGSDM
ncbi:hypothetical protein QC761_600170 [Podospora bellae-mahoneyi]|uniref:Uncharacterized protein n=1 Tax=Podospora bellae-mahoneyi TaxID=2093777 RepID=A0ABR0FBH0_9PEZI|nr:hypothetical protein QC761_600170 [Podospora bellae-mahoneyi]